MKYNTMFDIAFTIDHDTEDARDIPADTLIDALERRIQVLKDNPGEALEAFGYNDTIELEEKN